MVQKHDPRGINSLIVLPYMKKIRIGLLGLGTVGQGVWKHIQNNRALLEGRLGVSIELQRAAVANLRKKRGVRIASTKMTQDPWAVVDDPKIDIVCELMGGTELARQLTLHAFAQGKAVVTANKALICACGAELFKAAQKHGGHYFFEASVAGGIPIIQVLREGLVVNRFRLIYGILNGTSNYILTRMEREALTFDQTLQDARALGYVEADETLDLDGWDAAHKAVILAFLAHGRWVQPKSIQLEGIRNITTSDIEFARELGFKIKLLAVIRRNFETNRLSIGVYPTLLPLSNMMAQVDDVFNGIHLRGDVAGESLLVGRGAGQDATASAVISDIVDAILAIQGRTSQLGASLEAGLPSMSDRVRLAKPDEIVSSFYMRCEVQDEPGVLWRGAQVFSNHGVSIARMIQKSSVHKNGAALIFTTHSTNEKAMANTVRDLQKLKVVISKPFLLRILEEG